MSILYKTEIDKAVWEFRVRTIILYYINAIIGYLGK